MRKRLISKKTKKILICILAPYFNYPDVLIDRFYIHTINGKSTEEWWCNIDILMPSASANKLHSLLRCLDYLNGVDKRIID